MELAKALEPAPLEPPCGPNLKGTLEWAEFERLAQGKPAQYVGPNLVAAAEEPRWPDVVTRATDLLGRSKDLRIAVHLVKASLRLRGWSGLAEGLGLIHQMMERYWDQLHPELDREDHDDPTLRLNCLAELSEDDSVQAAVRNLPLVIAPRAGKFSLRDIAAARAAPAPANPKQAPAGPTPTLVAAAFAEAELAGLVATADSVHQALEHVRALELLVSDKVGPAHPLNLTRLRSLLEEADRLLADNVKLRQPANGTEGEVMTETNGTNGTTVTVATPAAGGPIRTREDVIRALDAVCEYYRTQEPSSPIPLLLRRARRLVAKDFMEILQDLAPAGVTQAQSIRGPEEAKS